MPSAVVNFIDMAGRKYGRLTVIARAPNRSGKSVYWLCVCDCGTKRTIYGANLRRGLTKSCGCLNQENRLRPDLKITKHGHASGGKPSRTYISWRAMIDRCLRPNNKDWAKYGGRGIKVCPQWQDDFLAFLRDMGERPGGRTLDRDDVNGDYTPDNCQWGTSKRQARNTRRTHRLEIDGQTMPLADWSEASGIGVSTIRERLKRGWSAKDAANIAPLPKGLAVLHPSRRAARPQPDQTVAPAFAEAIREDA